MGRGERICVRMWVKGGDIMSKSMQNSWCFGTSGWEQNTAVKTAITNLAHILTVKGFQKSMQFFELYCTVLTGKLKIPHQGP